MGFIPKIPPKKHSFSIKKCTKCGELLGSNEYAHSNSIFFQDGVFPICNNCIKEFLNENDWNWQAVDKLCQMGDIPFIPKEWERIHEDNGEDSFPLYANVFGAQTYENIDWADYYEQFRDLKNAGIIEDELPKISDEKYGKLKKKWGANYAPEELDYLEDLYNGILATQNVSGALQTDQAIKLCKISLDMNSHIREGTDFDKLMSSYDKLAKIADFTPKNVKNASDFDSVGELFHWLEKRGWVNQYYDDVSKDVLDEMMQNFENYNQRLYVNESGISEEISRRIEQLKTVDKNENQSFYGTNETYDLDQYDNDGYDQLMNEDFKEEV